MKSDYSKKFLILRNKLGLTQSEMSDKLGVSRVTISQIELGKQKPTLELIQGVINIFNISSEYFFNKNNDELKEYTSINEAYSNANEPESNYFYQGKSISVEEIIEEIGRDYQIKSLEEKIQMFERIIESKDQTIELLKSQLQSK